jgi:uncharacterized coiled-coil DUF342 family protein
VLTQLDSYKEENEKLKRQVFSVDKQRTQMESQMIDMEDNMERLRKEADKHRKKYLESK